MEHYITEIKIDNLRHLSNIVIPLKTEQRQHLIITGKNGSGKTSLLIAVQKYLQAINENYLNNLVEDIPKLPLLQEVVKHEELPKYEIDNNNFALKQIIKYADGVRIQFSNVEHIDSLYAQGRFITAYFPVNRKTRIVRAKGVEDVKLSGAYAVDSQPGQIFHKYMVHLKTQQSYARNEGDIAVVDRIQEWFERFEGALRILLDDDTISLKYDYKEYDFKIYESGRNPFGLEELSDGYSSVIQIVSDLILRMDRNWLSENEISQYDIEGIVLIDEIETHLHIGLQKKIMPFLTEFFPRVQFIVSTHSPYILNSLSNVKVYDLENCIELENPSVYTSDELAEGYFGVDEFSEEIKRRMNRYQYLKEKPALTDEERAERARLRMELQNIPRELSPEIADMLHDIEKA